MKTSPGGEDEPSEVLVVEALKAIDRNDKSERYEYGEARRDGTHPSAGQRWQNPREIARSLLARLSTGTDDTERGEP